MSVLRSASNVVPGISTRLEGDSMAVLVEWFGALD